MAIPSNHLQRIHNAMLDACAPGDLAQIVRFGLDERLVNIAGGENFSEVVFNLVLWAERNGRLRQLVLAAHQRSPDNPDLAALAEQIDQLLPAPPDGAMEAAAGLWLVPFGRSEAFFGREDDLRRLHAALAAEAGAAPGAEAGAPGRVGIRPAGVTGLGGIGKTQLAVEYVYLHRGDYPGGVFWLNAAADWRAEFAALGVYLRPELAGQGQEAPLRAAADYLTAHPGSLLVLDNVDDPQRLRRPLAPYLTPAALPCRLIFTTRERELGAFRGVELRVLPEGPGLRLLLRHASRQAALRPDHPEHAEAQAVYRLLGGLPLALEVAGAFLGEWPEVRLAAFRGRLHREGVLAALDAEGAQLSPANLPAIHGAAVAATLGEQWDALDSGRPVDEDARLLLRVAGQLPEAAQIPAPRLGLLAGLAGGGEPGAPSRLARALRRLERASLVEELAGDLLRLHPLVREFAAGQTPAAEAGEFRHACAARLLEAYDDLAVLEEQCARRGIDAVQQDMLAGLELLGEAEAAAPLRATAQFLLRALGLESHLLRPWDAAANPAWFRQQWLKRMLLMRDEARSEQARAFLAAQSSAHLEVAWTTAQDAGSLARPLEGHGDSVWAAVVTADGRRAISGSRDGTLRVWELQSGECVRTIRGHSGPVNTVAVTADGRQTVSGSWDHTLRVWDLQSGECVRTLAGHSGRVLAVEVTADGRHAVSGSGDGTLRVWDVQSGESVRILEGHSRRVRAVAVTADGRRAVSGSDDGTLRVWELRSGECVRTLAGHDGRVLAVAVTADGRRAVSGSSDRMLRVWDLQSGECVRTFEGHSGWVRAVAVATDGRRAVSGSDDGTLRVWDVQSGECVRTLAGHSGWVNAVAVMADGRRAVSGSDDKTLRVWDLQSGESIRTLAGHNGPVNAAAVTADGRRAVTGSDDGTLRVWDMQRGECVRTLAGHSRWVNAVVMTADGRRAVSGSSDGTLRVWDLQSGECVRTLQGHSGAVWAVAVTADGRRAVSGSDDGTLRVWDVQSGECVRILHGHSGSVNAVAVAADGRRAVSGSDDKTLRVWDVQSKECVHSLEGHDRPVLAVAVTADGRRAVSGSYDHTLQVWDVQSGESVHTLEGHSDWVNAVAVTVDGRRAVSGSDDNTLRVWDLQRGAEEVRLALDAEVRCVAIAPDGRTIIAGDAAGDLWCVRLRPAAG